MVHDNIQRARVTFARFLLFRLALHTGALTVCLQKLSLGILLCAGIPTGAAAGPLTQVGVFGVVQSASPLVVAGVEIEVPADVPVLSPLGVGQSVGLGDTVAVVAYLEDKRLIARRMLAVYSLIGPVENVSETTAYVLGSAVHIPPDVSLSAGQRVAVSGYWSAETVITSNLRLLEGDEDFAQITGVVGPDNRTIGTSDLTFESQRDSKFDKGVWVLSGAPHNAGLRVAVMSRGVFGAPPELVVWQGYASHPIASQTYTLYGTGFTGTARDADMPKPGTLITRCVQGHQVVSRRSAMPDPAFDALGCFRHIPAD